MPAFLLNVEPESKIFADTHGHTHTHTRKSIGDLSLVRTICTFKSSAYGYARTTAIPHLRPMDTRNIASSNIQSYIAHSTLCIFYMLHTHTKAYTLHTHTHEHTRAHKCNHHKYRTANQIYKCPSCCVRVGLCT